MVTLYYTTYFTKPGDQTFAQYLSKVPEELRKKILAYRRWEDSTASLYGKLLLLKGLENFGIKTSLSNLKYSRYGRPFLENQIDFNISHSGNLVACAFVKSGVVGLDLEEIKEIDLRDFQAQFSEKEWSRIRSSEDQYREFYRLWTIKEAVIKATGDGLNMPLNQLDAIQNPLPMGGNLWFVRSVDILNNYQIHLVSDNETTESVKVIEVKFDIKQ